MSFYSVIQKYKTFDFDGFFSGVTAADVDRTLARDRLRDEDLLVLLSPAAAARIEPMARRAQALTRQHFGRVIGLYTPLYLANICDNQCSYCGFKHDNPIARKKLSLEEVEREAQAIARTGLRHILILTGESRVATSVSYLKDCVGILKRHFASISIEVYPLELEEYRELIEEGVDGLTVYQETFDEERYGALHLRGPKRDYRYRLDTPERACRAGMRYVGLGALLGLADARKDSFFTALHAAYLEDRYPGCETGVSLPRIQPQVGGFEPAVEVTDREFVQTMLAYRLFLPRAGITVSTRECASFRDNLVGLGVTRISAGSRTEVGGYAAEKKSEGQFTISDDRDVEEIRAMLYRKGYQPVMKDWQTLADR